MKNENIANHVTPIQLKVPIELSTIIDDNDPVYSIGSVVDHIDLGKLFNQDFLCFEVYSIYPLLFKNSAATSSTTRFSTST